MRLCYAPRTRRAIAGIRIEWNAVAIEGEFETAAFQVRESVRTARIGKVDPNRQA